MRAQNVYVFGAVSFIYLFISFLHHIMCQDNHGTQQFIYVTDSDKVCSKNQNIVAGRKKTTNNTSIKMI